jgi:hypothetical protein
VGARALEARLGEKEAVAGELDASLRERAAALGLEVVSLGIRDVMLPGEMKELMNKVIEAQKAAEAALVTRREEIAAMRSQANTARLMEQNPTLMRPRGRRGPPPAAMRTEGKRSREGRPQRRLVRPVPGGSGHLSAGFGHSKRPGSRAPLASRFVSESPRSPRAASATPSSCFTTSGCRAATSVSSPMSFARS